LRALTQKLSDGLVNVWAFARKRLMRKPKTDGDMVYTSALGSRMFSMGSRFGNLKHAAGRVLKLLSGIILALLLFIAFYDIVQSIYLAAVKHYKALQMFEILFNPYEKCVKFSVWTVSILGTVMAIAGMTLYPYIRSVAFLMRHRYKLLAVGTLVLFNCSVLYKSLDKEFVGSTEENEFIIFVELPSGTKLAVSDKVVGAVEKAVGEIPEIQKSVKTAVARVEGWSSKLYVTLVPQSERVKTAQEIITELRPLISKIGQEHDAFVYFSEPVSSKEFLIDVFGGDYGKLRDVAVAIAKNMEKVPGLADIKLRYKEGRPEVRIQMDRQKASSFQFTVEEVAESLHAQIRGLRATYFLTPKAQIETVARLKEQFRKTLEDVQLLTLINGRGVIVPIRQFAEFNLGLTPSEIWRKDRERMIQVSANRGDLSLNKVAREVDKALQNLQVPTGYYYEFGGDFPKLVETEKESRFSFIVMVVLIFAVLASLFESYSQPLVILTAVPLTAIGAIPLLYVTGTPVTLGAMIGFIMLGGISVGNSIILVDIFNNLRKRNGTFKALLLAGIERTRPILMTSLTAILGLFPLVLDRDGTGSLWSPLAITVIGGLTASTALVLYVLPCFYLLLQDAQIWAQKRLNLSIFSLKTQK